MKFIYIKWYTDWWRKKKKKKNVNINVKQSGKSDDKMRE